MAIFILLVFLGLLCGLLVAVIDPSGPVRNLPPRPSRSSRREPMSPIELYMAGGGDPAKLPDFMVEAERSHQQRQRSDWQDRLTPEERVKAHEAKRTQKDPP